MKTARVKAWAAWSSGKDAAWALYETRRAGEVEVVKLLTTVTRDYARVSMHSTREALLDRQAAAAGLPLRKVYIPAKCDNAAYEVAMKDAMDEAAAEGATHVVFGDLFLQDIREYRETQLAKAGMKPLFPLWGRDTAVLAREMIAGGLKAYLTCVDPRKVPADFAGRSFDDALLADLPAGVDPCGENGEFHTVVVAGPMFKQLIAVRVGEVVQREGFVFADVVPEG
jgi:uncharacterized protein (TIGR00290 family)